MIRDIFNQKYTVKPCEVLENYLKELSITEKSLADRTGMSEKEINDLLRGTVSMTNAIAVKLEYALGKPAHFWIALEDQYQKDVKNVEDLKNTSH